MIEFAKVKLPKKFGVRNKNRIFHHRDTENTERELGRAMGIFNVQLSVISYQLSHYSLVTEKRGSGGGAASQIVFFLCVLRASVVESPIPKFFYPLFMRSMVESTVIPKWHVLNRAIFLRNNGVEIGKKDYISKIQIKK